MPAVINDPATLETLRQARKMLELRDATGTVLGYFVPECTIPKISDEELERRKREGGGRPLKDILSDLEKRKP